MYMESKICTVCEIDRPLESFNKSGKNLNGSQRYKAWCKDCTKKSDRSYNDKEEIRQKTKKRDQARAAKYLPTKEKVYDYLKNNPCVDCGEADILYLEFDHIRDKTMGIGKLMQRFRKWEDIKNEIDKCEVRCVKCHRKKTATQFKWTILNYR